MPELSFIIVNYQSEKYLKKCVASVLEKVKIIDFEIIVVNNDQSKLNSFEDEKISVLEINKNVGFGKACNFGVEKARGELLCFLNPDAEIIKENIVEIIEEFKHYPKIGIIGPKILTSKNRIQKWSVGRETGIWNLFCNKIGYCAIWNNLEKQEVDWVTGAAMFIRQELFQQLGGFDENFFLYFEDLDLCRRARLIGFKVLYFPDFHIKHQGGKSSVLKEKQKEAYYQSQDYYFQKHFGRFSVAVLRFLRKIFLYWRM